MKSFFRQIFFFTKSQKRGLIVLLIVLLLVVIGNFFVPCFFYDKQTSPSTDTAFMAQVNEFYRTLQPKNNGEYRRFSPADFADDNTKNYGDLYRNKIEIRLFEFDPNRLDSVGFITLGIKPFVVKNIINYRKKGGKFSRKEDFSRIYGLSADDFARLSAYIRIEPLPASLPQFAEHKPDSMRSIKPDTLVVELNSADTAELKRLKGIGSYFARQIIHYRNALGGYYSINQLLEVKNFPSETFERIKYNIRVDDTKIKKINVNWATAERLNRHPYLNFYQSKAIFEFRKKQKFQTISDLSRISELSEEDIKRIEPYLEFK